MSDDSISKALGLPPDESGRSLALQLISTENNNDYEFARENLYQLIQKGMFALEDLMAVAKQSQSARAYEVMTNMIKMLGESNISLMELAKKRKEVEGKGAHDGEGPVASPTPERAFLGSTAELQAFMKRHGINARGLQFKEADVIDVPPTPDKNSE